MPLVAHRKRWGEKRRLAKLGWKSFRDVLIDVQIDIFMFHRFSQTFYGDIVENTASTVYADLDAFLQEPLGKVLTGEKCPLVRIENAKGPKL